MKNKFVDNKIFILFLFLIFMIWSVFIITFFHLDNRLEKLENKINYDMEVKYDK